MDKLEQFKIDLKALKGETTGLDFSIGDFFAAIDGSEVSKGHLYAHLDIRKSTGVYDFQFHITGTVTVACDLCLDDLLLPIEADRRLVVRLGDTYQEEDELIVVPVEEGVLDVAWLIYEMIALSIPIRHVHEEGGCDQQMLSRLNDFTSSDSHDGDTAEATDPRWKELEKLRTIFKD